MHSYNTKTYNNPSTSRRRTEYQYHYINGDNCPVCDKEIIEDVTGKVCTYKCPDCKFTTSYVHCPTCHETNKGFDRKHEIK